MKTWLTYLERNEEVLIAACLLLFLPAYLINLGMNPIMADEPTRAVVAQEMILSGNYLVPTINGEWYYNKPPFYNWLLAGVFLLSGSQSEWMVRLPSVLPLFLYGLTIFWVVRKELSPRIGLLTAIFFVGCGRMLVYSSLLGHIDIFYSWITFLSFWSVYHCYYAQKWLALFAVSYLLAGIGFLNKGLPSVVFQGITLFTFFVYQRQFRRLLSWQHLAGMGIFALVVGSYYFFYFRENPDIEGYLANLWSESSKRTVVEKAWYESIGHLFLFPFDQAMHLLPGSLLAGYLFHPGFRKQVFEHRFLRFAFWILVSNVVIYWLAPETRPRYVFMLYPLLFVLISYAYVHYKDQGRYRTYTRILEYLWWGVCGVFALGVWAALGVDTLQDIPFLTLKVWVLFSALALCTYLYGQLPAQRVVIFMMVWLLFRIGFDWFVIPHRYKVDNWRPAKEYGLKVAEITGDQPLYLRSGFEFNHHLTYYITRERRQILTMNDENTPGIFYICSDEQLEGHAFDMYYEFFTRSGNRPMNLVKFK